MNVQTTKQLCPFHMLAMWNSQCSKSFKLGFNSTWTKNFQINKLDLEEAGMGDQIANTHWIIEKTREFQKKKNLLLFHWLPKVFDGIGHNKLWKILKEMWIPGSLTYLLETCIQGNKQQLELDMEQLAGSKLGKECDKTLYCHPTYLTYMQSISCEKPGWMSKTWNQDC